MNARAGEVADALLAISDERAARAKNQAAKKAYEKLRPTGQEARRGGGAAPRPADREVHQRRGVGAPRRPPRRSRARQRSRASLLS